MLTPLKCSNKKFRLNVISINIDDIESLPYHKQRILQEQTAKCILYQV